MRDTNIFEKLFASLINVAIVCLLVSPSLLFDINFFLKKIIFISVFFAYSLFFIFYKDGRDVGMILIKSYWEKKYSYSNKIIYTLLYTASCASIFFHVWFPFDILIANLLFLQLPTIIVTKTTLHGYLSGNMKTIIK